MKKILFVLFIISSTSACSQQQATGYQNIDNKTFVQKAEGKDVMILDVRTPEEYKAGHIPNAKLVNFYADNFSTRIDSLDKSKTYLVYCAKGGRSSSASDLMAKKGFKQVYNLEHGFSQWNGAVEK